MEELKLVVSGISALAALGAVGMSFWNSRKIREVHISLNSRLDQMLRDRGDAREALGLEKGRSELRP